jgi:cobalt-zinc-cadmium efflux system membrane fusion protein
MTNLFNRLTSLVLLMGIVGCGDSAPGHTDHAQNDQSTHGETAVAEVLKGPHGGRLLVDGDFALELAIFETGVPPEFHVWATEAGKPIAPGEVDLRITLTRLGGVQDKINFQQQDDYLRGDTVIYEPHSFVVSIDARHSEKTHHWEYDNFEGRTAIAPDIATAFGLETESAGPATILETVAVYGRIVPNAESVRRVSARFAGLVESVAVSVGDRVTQGQLLATVEGNDSLSRFKITAPIAGVITERNVHPGEQTDGRTLFTIMDTSSVWAELAIFPQDRTRVAKDAPARVIATDEHLEQQGVISRIDSIAAPNQSVSARIVLDNPNGKWVPGMFVKGEIQAAEYTVPLAVKRDGLQAFRDFTVVFAQIGDEYEVRMLDLGRQDGEWIEVLGGLEAGTRYVTTNSYILKADIEKSGASHDH